MISVDISNVWGQIALPDLLALEKEVVAAHELLAESRGEVPEMERIWQAADRIREDSEVCVILGVGSCTLGARAAMELLLGTDYNQKKETGAPQIFFAGDSLSTRQWNALMGRLEGKDFSLIVLSEAGTTLEPAVALRGLRWILERKYGTDKANRRIYAVTDPENGVLCGMAREAGWELFSFGDGSPVRTAVGLLPMAVAGLDIQQIIRGSEEAEAEYDIRSLENPAWQYAVVRNLMHRGGKNLELIGSWEPDFHSFGLWWQQLFANAEGKDGKGLLPVPVEFTGAFYTLGQLIHRGQRNLFETMVRFAPSEQKHIIGSQWNDPDGLNYLEGKELDQVEEQVYFAATDLHVESGVPVIAMDCDALNERTIGELFRFLEIACGLSARVLGVDPGERTDAAEWETAIFSRLGKPETET